MTRLLLVLLGACAPAASDCGAEALAEGAVQARVDGQPWAGSGAAWMVAGEGVQVVTEAAGGWRITLVATRDAAGQPVAAALDALVSGDDPLDVDLSGDDGFAIAYPDGGGSLTSRDAAEGGALRLFPPGEDGALAACFSFTALGGEGDVALFSEGSLRASGR